MVLLDDALMLLSANPLAQAGVWLAITTLGCRVHQPASAPTVPAAPATSTASIAPAQCAVWDRELAFASALASHDERAFAEHVHPAAIFVEGDGRFLRGRAAIVAAWRPLIEGTRVLLYWHPTSVAASSDPSIAISRGPYLIEDPRPSAAARFRIGMFQSVWVKDTDGAWRVFVDGGTPPPVVATPDDAEKLKRELRAPCVGAA